MLPIMEEMCDLKSPQLMGGTENKNKTTEHPQIQKYVKGVFIKYFRKWLLR
jgi:hypothetical protein